MKQYKLEPCLCGYSGPCLCVPDPKSETQFHPHVHCKQCERNVEGKTAVAAVTAWNGLHVFYSAIYRLESGSA